MRANFPFYPLLGLLRLFFSSSRPVPSQPGLDINAFSTHSTAHHSTAQHSKNAQLCKFFHSKNEMKKPAKSTDFEKSLFLHYIIMYLTLICSFESCNALICKSLHYFAIFSPWLIIIIILKISTISKILTAISKILTAQHSTAQDSTAQQKKAKNSTAQHSMSNPGPKEPAVVWRVHLVIELKMRTPTANWF